MPASPANVIGSPPIATPEAGQLGQAPGDDRGAGVVAGAEAVGHARGDGDDVLQRAADLAADDVVVRVHPEQLAGEAPAAARAAMWSSPMATTVAAAWPARISLARFGPVEHADRVAGQHLGDDLGHAQVRALLEALGQADDRHPRPHVGRQPRASVAAEAVRRHAHHEHVGRAAPPPRGRRWPRSVLGQVEAGEVGRCCGGPRRSPRPARGGGPTARSGRCATASAATVVPHDPAPMTATRIGMAAP